MATINRVTIIGNLGKDPITSKTESGKLKTILNIATSESYKDDKGVKMTVTDWHTVTLWNSIAEIGNKYLKKGSRVYIEGKLKSRSYIDKDKVKKYVTDIIGKNLILLTNKSIQGLQEQEKIN